MKSDVVADPISTTTRPASWMLDQFVGTCDLIEGQNLRNVESLPPRPRLNP